MVSHDLLKLAMAAVLGILVGLERELKHKPLGLKTCLVISITSCLLTVVSIDSATIYNQGAAFMRADPNRITAQIVSGIGFLGAGVILHKEHDAISGLTTAAIVWAAAGLGIAVGAGFYVEALIGISLIIISVELLPIIMRRFGPRVLREKEMQVMLRLTSEASLSETLDKLKSLYAKVESVKSTQESDRQDKEVTMICIVDNQVSAAKLFETLVEVDGVKSLSVERI